MAHSNPYGTKSGREVPAMSDWTKCCLSAAGSLSIVVSMIDAHGYCLPRSTFSTISFFLTLIRTGSYMPLQEPSVPPRFEECVFTANSVRPWTDDVWQGGVNASTSGR